MENKSRAWEISVGLGVVLTWPLWILIFLGLLFTKDAAWTSVSPGDQETVFFLVLIPGLFVVFLMILRYQLRIKGLPFIFWAFLPLVGYIILLSSLLFIEVSPVSLSDWSEKKNRPLVTRYLIKSKVLISKKNEEILKLLGHPDEVHGNVWIYENRLFYKDKEMLVVSFEGAYVSWVKLEP